MDRRSILRGRIVGTRHRRVRLFCVCHRHNLFISIRTVWGHRRVRLCNIPMADTTMSCPYSVQNAANNVTRCPAFHATLNHRPSLRLGGSNVLVFLASWWFKHLCRIAAVFRALQQFYRPFEGRIVDCAAKKSCCAAAAAKKGGG